MQRKCYSYIRFSHKKQELGTSFARQSDIQHFVDKHNLIVDTTLEDLGVSAFRGKNAKQGQLGDFIDLVEQGLIDQNSILLIENFDRLSRQKVIKSTQIFLNLLNRGIDIAVLDTGKIYSKDTLLSSDFFIAIIEFERANAESSRKSDFTSSAWNIHRDEMRKTKAVKTRKTPSWIGVSGVVKARPGDESAKFFIIENEARKIRKIFDLALSKGLSETARAVNEWLGPDEPKYSIHQIQYLLKNRKVIGEHQPMKFYESETSGQMKLMPEGPTIYGYYPAIIDKAIFEEVQEKISGRKPFSGKFNKSRLNIFQGFITCYHCAGTIRYMDKSSSERSNKHYFVCTNSMTGKCVLGKRLTYNASEAMQFFFEKTDRLNLSEIFENDENILRLNNSIKDVERALKNTNHQLEQLKKQIREMLRTGKNISDTLNEMLIEFETLQREQTKALKTLKEEKETSIAQIEVSRNFNQENIFELLNDKSDEATRKRININNHLKQIIENIQFFCRGYSKKNHDTGVEDKRSTLTPTMIVKFKNGAVRVIVENEMIKDIGESSGGAELYLNILEDMHQQMILKKALTV
ncbi:recombinase family protein [Pseudomonas proteolytica]|uniref:recombinase family protein n=1 Tax=Pseudomonas proteolytica TaxID=219574 RepID=UPI001472D873|nr:recombinase family protein [Pseudomonas proteolytica]NMZ39756.1 recombinase family protein [Pseudomonas proteolytica]